MTQVLYSFDEQYKCAVPVSRLQSNISRLFHW
jgi:hypothetical protein